MGGGGVVGRAVGWWVGFSMARPVAVLAAVLAVTLLCLVPVSRLRLNPDMGALLPKGTLSAARLDEASRRIGGTDLFALTFEGDDEAANRAAAGRFAAELGTWKECRWAATGRALGGLGQKALLLVPEEGLRRVVDAIRERIETETCRRSPLCAEIEEKTPADLAGVLREVFEDALPPALADEETRRRIVSAEGGEGERPLASADGRVAALLARLSRPATDIDFAREVRARVDGISARVPAVAGGKVAVAVRGAYDATREYEIIRKEAAVFSLFSLGLMALIVLTFMRRARSLPVVLAPLVVASVWSLAFASLAYRELNTLTAFIVGILMGMGIDYAVHLQRRFAEESARGEDERAAMRAGIAVIARPLATAAVTTIGALLTLRAAHFRGFREYGTIAAVGIVFAMLAALVVIPPMNALFSRVRRRYGTGAPPEGEAPRPPAMVEEERGRARRSLPAPTPGRILAVALLLVTILGTLLVLPHAFDVRFETDFKRLRAPGVGEVEPLERAIGTGRANPLILLGASEEQVRRIHPKLAGMQREGEGAAGGALTAGFLTIASVIPDAAAQERRLALVGELRGLLATPVLRHAQGEAGARIGRLRALADVSSPIVFDDLPPWLRALFTEKDGTRGRIAYVYPAIDRWNADGIARLRARWDAVGDGGGGKVPVASSSYVILDIVATVQRDLGLVGLLSSVFILLVLLAALRSPVGAVVCFGAVSIGLLWTFALMKLTGVGVGVYNLLVLPTLLGTGIDSSVYLWHRWKQVGSANIAYLMGSTGLSTLIASLTTAAGFSGLLFSVHPGLRSIAWFALPGMLLVVGFSLVILPAVFVLKGK